MMKLIISNSLILYCLIFAGSCIDKDKPINLKPNSIFQYSTLSALLEGIYDGEMTIGELKKHGNFGIGTFNALDGEMVLYEGHCYKVTSDSKVLDVSDSNKTPFATVCKFEPDTVIRIDRTLNLMELKHYIDSIVTSTNLLYAYQISGSFDSIIVRSVPKQKKPYKRLIEAYKAQGIYTFTHQEGILIGYKFPVYLKDANMEDFHLHFLSTDKTKGGHLMNCKFTKGTLSVAFIHKYNLQLPKNIYFNTTKFTNKKSELLKIEGGN